MFEKRGQIWVETVIYTLIGLAIMGSVIAVVTPKIQQMNDKVIITQTIDAMNQINEQVNDALEYAGNQRAILLSVKKGEYNINSPGNSIYYVMKNTNLLYSQPNASIKQGDLTILTKEKGNKKYDIFLTLNYPAYNITYNGKDINKSLTSAPAPYSLLIINRGGPTRQIDIQLLSG